MDRIVLLNILYRCGKHDEAPLTVQGCAKHARHCQHFIFSRELECPPSQHPIKKLCEEGVGESAFGGDGVEMFGEADAMGGLLQEA